MCHERSTLRCVLPRSVGYDYSVVDDFYNIKKTSGKVDSFMMVLLEDLPMPMLESSSSSTLIVPDFVSKAHYFFTVKSQIFVFMFSNR